MRYPENATPLIVVGRQRAGTRFLAGALNRFPEITIQAEIPDVVMRYVEKFIEDTDRYYQHKATDDRSTSVRYGKWDTKKEQLLLALWATVGQSPANRPGKECRYFGYKRPNNEFYFSFYEKHFTTRKPIYIYCARNFVDNYLSISSRWPDRSIRQVAKDYLASIEQYKQMKRSAPERVLKFVLDEYVEEGMGYLERNVFEQLNLRRTSAVETSLRELKPSNTTVGMNIDRRVELTARERRFVERNSRLQAEFESLLG